jgi:uncharacterized protein YlxW (UPF0749 family)
MKSWIVIVFVVLSFCPSAAQVSKSDETDNDVSSQLEILVKEIRDLRAQVKQLEKRIALIEGEKGSTLLRGPSTTEIDQQIRIVIPKRPKRDLGLYVFPGLDAPPLSPENVKPD